MQTVQEVPYYNAGVLAPVKNRKALHVRQGFVTSLGVQLIPIELIDIFG